MVELLSRKRQLAIKEEAIPGTFESDLAANGTAKAYADFHVIGPSWSPSPLMFDRELLTPTLTPIKQHAPGVTAVELSFMTEMSRHTTQFEEPPAWRILRGCGFEVNTVRGFAATVNNVSTRVMLHKEGVTTDGGGGGSGTGTVYGAFYSATGTLDFKIYIGGPESFLFGDTITGDVSGETADLTGRNGSQNRVLSPISDPDSVASLSMVYFIDGKAVSVKGARGTAEVVMEHANIARVSYTFTGILHGYDDRDLMTGADRPSIFAEDPAFLLADDLQLTDVDGQNIVNEPQLNHVGFNVNVNNEVVLREDSSLGSGWTAAILPTRRMTMSTMIDEDLNSVYDFRSRWENGQPFGIKWGIEGRGAGTGDGFRFRIPAGQLINATPGDRDAVTTWELEFMLSQGTYVDAAGNTISVEDNDIVIINI